MSLLIGAGLIYCGFVGGYFINEFGLPKIKKATTSKDDKDKKDNEKKLWAYFTSLFGDLGILKYDRGDRIGNVKIIEHANYRLIKFSVNTSMSCVDFQKAIEKLKEKLQVKHLEIYTEKGFIYFKMRNDELPLVSYEFKKTSKHLVRLGLDMDDKDVMWDMKADPHMLLCGTTGCGKSRLLNSAINHLYNNIPGCHMYLVDLKRGLELGDWADTKNCQAYAEVLGEVKSVIAAFDEEQEKRYKILKEAGYRDYNDYIKDHPNSNLKRAFLVVDEFADLQRLNNNTKNKEYNIVDVIVELACKVRALGMHIILATQRPTVNFISSDIKANMSCIIGMRAMNELNSRLIIDENGLEELDRAQCIGIIGSKKTFFRAYKFEPQTIKETCKVFAKPKEEKPQEEPKEEPKQNKKKAIK